ncbi:hypothetical protein CRUP_025639, partial [Coryphaenoides rupestris]
MDIGKWYATSTMSTRAARAAPTTMGISMSSSSTSHSSAATATRQQHSWCSVGYYGNPSLAGGRCEPCGCSLWGALQGACHPTTGQCPCRPGVR